MHLEQSEELHQHGAVAHVRWQVVLAQRDVDRTEELRRLLGGEGWGWGKVWGWGGVWAWGWTLGLGLALAPGRWLAGQAHRRGRPSA